MCVLACWHVFWSRPAMSHGTLYLSSPSLFLPSSSNPLFLHSSHDPLIHTSPANTHIVIPQDRGSLFNTSFNAITFKQTTHLSLSVRQLSKLVVFWSSLTLKKVTFLDSLSLNRHTDSRREGAPLKQVSRSPNCSPAHKNYQRPTEQPTDSSSPANSPRHALKPPNGFLAQKKREQDRDRDMDGITQDTVSVVKVDKQGLLNGDAGDVAKREIMDEDCVDPPHAHIEQAEEEERKTPEQCEVVMDSIPEQKVTWFCVREDWWGVFCLSVWVWVCLWSL